MKVLFIGDYAKEQGLLKCALKRTGISDEYNEIASCPEAVKNINEKTFPVPDCLFFDGDSIGAAESLTCIKQTELFNLVPIVIYSFSKLASGVQDFLDRGAQY